MPRKTFLPADDLKLAARIQAMRKRRRWSRPDLAQILGVDSETIARVEWGRSPLQYWLAREIVARAGVHPMWLATGEGPTETQVALPEPLEMGLNGNERFLTVFADQLQGHLGGNATGQLLKQRGVPFSGRLPTDPAARLDIIANYVRFIESWFSEVPDLRLNDLSERIDQAAYGVLNSFPKDDWDLLLHRKSLMESLRAKGYSQGRFNAVPAAPASSALVERKNTLTSNPDESTVVDVKPKPITSWPDLRECLLGLTKERGGSAALARQFNVTPQAVSEWLRGKSMPSADTTIRLLQWVSGSGSLKQKIPAMVTATAGTKAQPTTESPHETKSKKGRKKR